MIETGYQASVRYLEQLYRDPIVPASQVGLARIRYLLHAVGNPHLAFRSVHVAGSCGKGSTVTMIGQILVESGFRTGFFRSPHLVNYTERICINDEEIGYETWGSYSRQILPVVDAMRDGSAPDYALGRPALFEVLFALACLHFAESAIEWAVIETGMGGRLDATNILASDIAVITNVSLEHTQILGSAVEAIAAEKGGIIKSGSPVVVGTDDQRVVNAIRERARELSAPLFEAPRIAPVTLERGTVTGQLLSLEEGAQINLKLAGPFQVANASTAIASVRMLADRGVMIDEANIVRGLERALVPGRFERIDECPELILDGAHNPAGARELRRALDRLLPDRKAVLVFAAMADKDVSSMARELAGAIRLVIVTVAPNTVRAARPGDIARAFRASGCPTVEEPRADLALAMAREEAGTAGLVVVSGSLYLVGYARDLLVAGIVAC